MDLVFFEATTVLSSIHSSPHTTIGKHSFGFDSERDRRA
jgi:hypothetical protein